VVRAALLLLALSIACAGAPSVRRPAHGEFAVASRAAVWEKALAVLSAEGYELGLADPERGIVITTERELQAPCGADQCLSKETLFLRLGAGGEAQLSLERSHWDQAELRFAPASDARSIEAVERTEAALLRAITGRGAELRLARSGESCGIDAECEPGLACRQRRCARR